MASSQDSQSFRWHYAEVDDKNFQIHGRSLLLVIILFSILILLTFLCLYTRWLCRYRQFAAPGIRPTQEQLPMAQLGLDAMTINSLPVHLHQSSTEEGQCSICLSSFQDEDKVKVLPDCNHSFHPECVDMWLSTHSSCPLCRSSLRKSSVDQLNEVA